MLKLKHTNQKKDTVFSARPRQQKRHETEAHNAARRVLSGEQDTSRFLSPAPAAAQVAKEFKRTAGARLPVALHRRLEKGFGANLDAVRIHFNDPAAQAAAYEQARAFTSGADIFFADRTYNPYSIDGQRLIAHEVAHVLQQTGQVDTEGILRATRRYGSSDVQREDEPSEAPSVPFTSFRDIYQGNTNSVSESDRNALNTMMELVQETVGVSSRLSPSIGESESAAALEAQVVRGEFDSEPAIARSFLYDALKFLGRFRAATHLVTIDPELQMATGPFRGFEDFVLSDNSFGLNWLTPMFREIPEIARIYPYNYLEAIWRYLMRPASAPSASRQYNVLTRDFRSSFRNSANSQFLKPNDRVVMTFLTLKTINDGLARLLRETEQANQLFQATQRRNNAAHFIRDRAREWAEHDLQYLRDLSPRVVAIAEQAIRFWSNSSELLREIDEAAKLFFRRTLDATNSDTALSPVEVPQLPAAIRGDRAFARFASQTKEHMIALLGGTPPTLLDSADYAEAIEQLQSSVNRNQRHISDRMRTIYRQLDIDNEDKFNLAIWLGMAMIFSDDIAIALSSYDSEQDRLLQLRYENLPDVRLHHRQKVARLALLLGHIMGDDALIALSVQSLRGLDVGQSYVALSGEWEQDIVATERLETDFPEARRLAGYGLNTNEIRRMYTLLRRHSLNSILRRMLVAEEANLSPESFGMVDTAIGESREQMPFPKRWIMREHSVVWNPNDIDQPGTRSIGELLENHPRFNELLSISGHSSDEYILSADRRTDVFVWFLPRFERLERYLFSKEGLRTRLETALGGVVRPTNLLFFLDVMAQSARGEDIPEEYRQRFREFIQELHRDIRQDLSTTERQQSRLFRRATTHDRRVSERLARRALQRYADDNSVSNYSQPNRVLDIFDRFRRVIRPEEDRDTQMATLVLSLAQDIQAALIQRHFGFEHTESRFDLITGFFGHLNLAIDFATAPHAPTLMAPTLYRSENSESLVANISVLRSVREKLRIKIRETQRQTGFQTNEAGDGLRSTGGSDFANRTIGPEDTFRIDGVDYTIIQIHRPFKYHPPYGLHTAAYTPSILQDLNGNDLSRSEATPLLDYIRSDDTRDPIHVTSLMLHDEELRRLRHSVQMALIVRQLEDLAATIEAGTMLVVEGAALVIPGGQVALTLAQLTQFLVAELPRIRREVLENPQQIVDAISQFVSPENRMQAVEQLWTYLLFDGDLPFEEQIQAHLNADDQRPRRRRRSKMARMLRFAGGVGAQILESFLDFRQAMQSGLIRGRRVVLRYPQLRRVVQALPTLISLAQTIDTDDIGNMAELLGDVANNPEQITERLQEALSELFGGLSELELPDEIIPMDLIVEIVIHRFLRSLGVKGKIIAEAIEATGFEQLIAEEVAEVLRDQGFDPNILWRGALREEMQALLHDTQVEMITGVNTVLGRFFGNSLTLSTSGLDRPQVSHDAAMPEFEPLLDDDEQPADRNTIHTAPRINAQAGEPLRPARRVHFEDAFGHDFSHVRVHSDDTAASLASFYGAQALTSGSHIFLGQEIAPESARADAVFRHELSHVLQQTGSRPHDLPSDPAPQLGRPGRGLTIDNRKEAAADHMARKSHYRSDDPIEVEEQGGIGLAPTLAGVAGRLIDELDEGDIASQFTQSIDEMRTVPRDTSTQRGFRAAVTDAQRIWTDTKGHLRSRTQATAHGNSSPFDTDDARSAIRTYFGTERIDRRRLRALTFHSIRRHRNGSVSLKKSRFIANLENYLYGRTGVSVRVDRTGQHVGWAKVLSIDLGLASARSNMYTAMRTNTNNRVSRMPSVTALDNRDWKRVRQIMRGGSFDSPTWDANEYRLHDRLIRELRTFLDDVGAGNVGNWADYVDTTSVSAARGGLRVGTHGQLTGSRTGNRELEPRAGSPGSGEMLSEARSGRQSHHVPQYLLVQYFRNMATTKLHKQVRGRNLLPIGFDADTGNADSFSDGNSGDINLSRLDPSAGRGAGLPAISIAARTHQRGRLHINAAFDWAEESDSDLASPEYTASHTQGQRINSVFYDYLRQRMGFSSRNHAAIVAESRAHPARHKPHVYLAMQDTYRWMYNMMITALRNGLKNHEVDYYKTVALGMPNTTQGSGENLQLKREYRPRNSDLTRVVAAVEGKNNSIMAQWK